MLSLPRLNIIHRQLDRPRAVRKLLGHVQHTQRPRQLLRLRVDIEARIFMCVYLHLHTPTNVCVGRGRRAFVCECVRACMNSQKQKRQQQPCASSKLTSARTVRNSIPTHSTVMSKDCMLIIEALRLLIGSNTVPFALHAHTHIRIQKEKHKLP